MWRTIFRHCLISMQIHEDLIDSWRAEIYEQSHLREVLYKLSKMKMFITIMKNCLLDWQEQQGCKTQLKQFTKLHTIISACSLIIERQGCFSIFDFRPWLHIDDITYSYHRHSIQPNQMDYFGCCLWEERDVCVNGGLVVTWHPRPSLLVYFLRARTRERDQERERNMDEERVWDSQMDSLLIALHS